MPVDFRYDMPAVGFETLRRIVGKPGHAILGTTHLAVDGDVVVVIESDQLAELQGTGKGAGFMRDALHQTAVAEESVGVVIDDLVAVTVELGGKTLFGDRHADGVADTLPQRTGGCLHAGRIAVFGMTWRLGVQLPELLQILDGEIVAGQVQQ